MSRPGLAGGRRRTARPWPEALDNAHPDVRLRAAKAARPTRRPEGVRAAVGPGDRPRAGSQKERQADWLTPGRIRPRRPRPSWATPPPCSHLIPPLDSPHGVIRSARHALALARVSTVDRTDALRQALQHADPEVKYRAAYGLACLGDASVASLVFSEERPASIISGRRTRSPPRWRSGPSVRRTGWSSSSTTSEGNEVRSRALLLLMMREWKDSRGTAARALACLSSLTTSAPADGGEGHRVAGRPDRLRPDSCSSLVNDKGRQARLDQVPEATVDALAEMLVHGGHRLQVRDRPTPSATSTVPEQDAVRPGLEGPRGPLRRRTGRPPRPRPGNASLSRLQYNAEQAPGPGLRRLRRPGPRAGRFAQGQGARVVASTPRRTRSGRRRWPHLLKLAEADPRHAGVRASGLRPGPGRPQSGGPVAGLRAGAGHWRCRPTQTRRRGPGLRPR